METNIKYSNWRTERFSAVLVNSHLIISDKLASLAKYSRQVNTSGLLTNDNVCTGGRNTPVNKDIIINIIDCFTSSNGKVNQAMFPGCMKSQPDLIQDFGLENYVSWFHLQYQLIGQKSGFLKQKHEIWQV